MKKIKSEDYLAHKNIEVSKIDTNSNFGQSKKDLKKSLKQVREALGEFQDMLYAHGKYGVLICLQGMDTAGKDSLIREVFKDFNARGVVVHSFKVPTDRELKHDYLWRHYIALPEKGKFSVFNRTHYENVLVTRVHPEYLLSQKLPNVHTKEDVDDAFWEQRFDQINNFERHIAQSGTIIFKFFLHLSKEEQKFRLLRRLERADKHWKFSPGDLKERKLWDNYQHSYQEAIKNTTHEHAPWFVIPADNKDGARLIVASILYQELKKYKDIKEPQLDSEIKANLELYKNQLEKE